MPVSFLDVLGTPHIKGLVNTLFKVFFIFSVVFYILYPVSRK